MRIGKGVDIDLCLWTVQNGLISAERLSVLHGANNSKVSLCYSEAKNNPTPCNSRILSIS